MCGFHIGSGLQQKRTGGGCHRRSKDGLNASIKFGTKEPVCQTPPPERMPKKGCQRHDVVDNVFLRDQMTYTFFTMNPHLVYEP